MNRSTLPRVRALLLIHAALICVGCGPTTVSQKLVGKWEGRPDTFAAQNERDPIPTAPGYQERTPPAKTVAESAMIEKVERMQPSKQTDLEQFDFVVTLEFKPQGEFDMWLDGGQQKSGAWHVLATDVGVSRIEMSDGVPPGEDAPDAAPVSKRRYSLKLDEDAQGFTLREEGVDPRFGWLYFRKAE